jgi:hypothetical protein
MSLRYYLGVVGILVMFFCGAAISQALPEEPRRNNAVILEATLAKLNLKNPTNDLTKSLKRGDNRFIGINGYSCDAPGVAEADRQFITTFGLNCLDGTSDVVGSDEHVALIQKATKYATSYNKELLRRIYAGQISPK